jgi:hypothetical protein
MLEALLRRKRMESSKKLEAYLRASKGKEEKHSGSDKFAQASDEICTK